MLIGGFSRVLHENGAYHRQAELYHELKAAGGSLRDIAEFLGTSPTRIQQIERQLRRSRISENWEIGSSLVAQDFSVGANGAGNKLRVLIADDHGGMRRALASFLSSDFEVIGAVNDGASLIATALAWRPDVIVSDV
jgi:PleD family two-component response regulator